jgi:hypothetical protein
MISHTEAIRILLSMFLMLCLGILGPIMFQAVYGKKIDMVMRVSLAGLCITILILYQWFYSYGLIVFNVR